jgi:chromosome segregation ATPase
MHRQINKLKSEFDNLSQLLKEVKKILSIKEIEINKCIACNEDLILLAEKLNERKAKQVRLSELKEEKEIIDKDIKEGKSHYEEFQKSEEFLNTSKILGKIDNKKNGIVAIEKNMINMFSNLSRPITKFSYLASKETQGMLVIILNHPLEIFDDSSQYLQLFTELRKQVVDKSIQIKDPEKTIHQIDEIVDSLPLLSSKLKKLEEELIQLESSVNSKNTRYLEEIKVKTEMYEKYLSENVSKTEETENSINELDSANKSLKKNIEENVSEITNTNYSIISDQK